MSDAARMARLDVVGLGFSSLDYLGIVPCLPTLDHGAPLLAFSQQGGGPVAQALVALARLGARVGYIGRFGDDEVGQRMRSDLDKEGVDLEHVQVEAGATSSVCIILIHQPTGKRSICCTRGSAGDALAGALDLDYVRSARVLHLDGSSHAAAERAARAAREAGVTVCLDAGGPSPGALELVPLVDLLIAGVDFAASVAPDGDYQAGAAQLRAMGPQVVVVTLGERGSYTDGPTGRFHTPAFEVPVVDTTGAGDTFHGAYLFGWLKHWDLETTAVFASAAAALTCRHLGGRAGIPRLDEVQAFLQQCSTICPRGGFE